MLFVLGKNQLKMYSCHRFIIHTHIFFNSSMGRRVFVRRVNTSAEEEERGERSEARAGIVCERWDFHWLFLS